MITLKVIIETIEQIGKESGPNQEVRPGPKSIYTDSYFIALIILKSLFGFSSESSFLRFLSTNELPGLTAVPEQSWYNRKAKKLTVKSEEIRLLLLAKLGVNDINIRIVDTVPVPVVSYIRAKRCRSFQTDKQTMFGYCAATKTRYFGKKLTVFATPEGIPTDYHLAPARPHDITIFKGILKDSHYSEIHFIGDKGYQMKAIDQQELLTTRNCRLTTPFKSNQDQQSSPEEKKLLRGRKIIETINSQLADQMELKRTRAKSETGLRARISGIMLAMTFGIYFNQLFGRNILSLKSILT